MATLVEGVMRVELTGGKVSLTSKGGQEKESAFLVSELDFI